MMKMFMALGMAGLLLTAGCESMETGSTSKETTTMTPAATQPGQQRTVKCKQCGKTHAVQGAGGYCPSCGAFNG